MRDHSERCSVSPGYSLRYFSAPGHYEHELSIVTHMQDFWSLRNSNQQQQQSQAPGVGRLERGDPAGGTQGQGGRTGRAGGPGGHREGGHPPPAQPAPAWLCCHAQSHTPDLPAANIITETEQS